MSFLAEDHSLPLRENPETKTVRVGNTRVSLDSVIHTFHRGSTPEEIVQQFPALELADVYDVIGHYLKHRDEIDLYIEERTKEVEDLKSRIKDEFGLTGLRERLLNRASSSGD